jgi:Leucine-rich repeat (LRR) protein
LGLQITLKISLKKQATMAIKSLLLSFTLSIILGYSFTAGLTNPNSLLRKLPDWSSFLLMAIVFVLYLLAAWWGFKGFSEHKLTALFSLGLCTLGLGVYAVIFVMEMGHGKASPGQYDYNFSKLAPLEKTVLEKITANAGLTLADATFSEHWRLKDPAAGFRVCVQKGHVTALNFSGKKIPDPGLFNQLPALEVLYLNNCGLSDMRALKIPELERLELADNQIADLHSLAGCPKLGWLDLHNNQLHSKSGIELFPKLVSSNFTGNPLE